MGEFRFETERLILREWREDDWQTMYAIGQDPRVMATLGPLQSPEDARKLVAGQIVNQKLFGHCFWPIERRSDRAVLGYCGLNRCPVGNPLEGKIEIGWKVAYHVWGQGYAREAAEASLGWAWDSLQDDAVWSMTTPGNTRSWGLMERLGMTRHHNLDFDHPALAVDDPLRAHITYSIARPLLVR
jgi:RimJ/RimL family protein N-acetyltransferase